MKKLIAFFFLALTLSLPAHAKYSFGEQDHLHEIQDIALKGPEGQSLYLGYRTTAMNVFAGVYLKDQGYILGIKDESGGSYYALDEKLIREFQADGSLPKPLPKYKIDTLDYLFGYSLWLILLVLAVFYGGKALLLLALSRRQGT